MLLAVVLSVVHPLPGAVIDAPSALAPSEAFEIRGHGLGDRFADVTVGSKRAIVTEWTPTNIRVHVPEGLAEGSHEVSVRLAEATVNAGRVEVEPRKQVGRILWRFRTDRWMNRQFVGIGPDGRVYTSDRLGLYALSPQGALLWFSPGSGGGHAIDFLPDGTIITSVNENVDPQIVRALNPDGTIRWEFEPPTQWNLIMGPNVGPDGNIYGAQDKTDEGGLGAFSLDQNGKLRWSNVGNSQFGSALSELTNSEVAFGDNRAYMGLVRARSGGNPVTYGFDFQGQQTLHTAAQGSNRLFHTFPRVDPTNRLIGSRGQTGIQALNPDATVAWQEYHPGSPNLMKMPTIDSKGNVYAVDFIGVELWALDSEGNTRYVLPPVFPESATNVGVSPDDSILVVSGSTDGDGWVRGYLAENGDLLWQVDLERELGWPQYSHDLYPTFSRSVKRATRGKPKQIAYVTTNFSNVQEVPYGYIYAIDIQ